MLYYEDDNSFSFKIIVVGDPGVGKTSIIRRYVEDTFTSKYRTTIGVDFALKVLSINNSNNNAFGSTPPTIIRLQLWDIAGQERFGVMNRIYFKEAVGAIVVFDITNRKTFVAAEKWKKEIDSKVFMPMEAIIGGTSSLSPNNKPSSSNNRRINIVSSYNRSYSGSYNSNNNSPNNSFSISNGVGHPTDENDNDNDDNNAQNNNNNLTPNLNLNNNGNSSLNNISSITTEQDPDPDTDMSLLNFADLDIPIPAILLANKCDLKAANNTNTCADGSGISASKCVTAQEIQEFADANKFCAWFETSAKLDKSINDNIDVAVKTLVEAILLQIQKFKHNTTTTTNTSEGSAMTPTSPLSDDKFFSLVDEGDGQFFYCHHGVGDSYLLIRNKLDEPPLLRRRAPGQPEGKTLTCGSSGSRCCF